MKRDGSGTGGRWVVGRYLSFPQRCRSLEGRYSGTAVPPDVPSYPGRALETRPGFYDLEAVE